MEYIAPNWFLKEKDFLSGCSTNKGPRWMSDFKLKKQF